MNGLTSFILKSGLADVLKPALLSPIIDIILNDINYLTLSD